LFASKSHSLPLNIEIIFTIKDVWEHKGEVVIENYLLYVAHALFKIVTHCDECGGRAGGFVVCSVILEHGVGGL